MEHAQGNPVMVLGYRNCKIALGEKLVTEYPIVVFKANHQEILLGYTFLVDHGLNIYCGKGIGLQPTVEIVKRLNYVEKPMECTPMEEETIPPKAIKMIKVKVWLPSEWTQSDRIAAIGLPIVLHSEDLETVGLNQLRCPYVYEILGIDLTANLLIDNSDNTQPYQVRKDEIIAHAEFVHEEVPSEQVKRIIKDSSYSIDEETLMGEYKLQTEDKPDRFEYVDKINIKSEDSGTAEFCKNLLTETEEFWSKSTFDMGRFDRKARMTLNTTTPIWDKYRPINPNKEKQAQEIVDQLEKHNIISRANSPFCSQPVWCWKKPKDKVGKTAVAGEADYTAPRALRLALDYRRINKLISSQCHFPNPGIKEILFKLKAAKYISIMDLTNSYWHIELTDDTKPILAFQTGTAQYVWNRLPQGTAPSMSIMAEAVQDTIYSGGIANCCICYVDNIIVVSDSLNQHKKDLRRTIEAFIKRGWKANPAKSHVFINTECRLFGFNINLQTQTIGPDPQKVQAIMNLPQPTNQKSARSICGSVNYYSDLIPDLAPLMAPIHEITKDGKFEWNQECQANFQTIKEKLAKMPVIYMADFNEPMHLFTDAAMGQFLGYHISQYKPSLNKFVPVSWGSHKFSKNEQSMSQPEAELFAIVHAVMQESLLLGFSKIIVHTDCRSLTYLFRFAKICSKLTRWQLVLSSFDIDIYFESSESTGIKLADMLSRRPGKRMTNRKPTIAEIEQLPKVDLSLTPQLTLQEAKVEIMKVLATLPPVAPETIKYITDKYTPLAVAPEHLQCNKQLITGLIKSTTELEKYANNQFTKQFVYTPEQLAIKNDISPSGRLINFVLQEAPGLSLSVLKHHQMEDPYFGPIMKQMIKTNTPVQDYALRSGIMLKETKDPITEISYQVCVPKSLSLELIGKFHYSIFGSHPDLKKLMTNLKKRFFIKNLKNECLEITKNCQVCSLNKSFNIMKQPFGAKLKVTGPRQIYALDICTVDTQAKHIDDTLPTSFLIITDVWCLYTIAVPVNANETGRDILEKFSRHIIQPFGIPKIGIVTDGAKNFSNKLSNTFSSVLGLQQFRISPYNARANPAERVNRAILSGLRYASQQFHLNPEVFKNLLNYIILAWNTSVLSHINFSPYQLFLSTPYEPAALTSFVTIQEADRDYGDFIQGLLKTQHIVENLVNQKYKETRDKRYKRKEEHSKYTMYSPGMQVMVRKREDNTKRAHKLRPRYSGPYKVVTEYQNNIEIIPWMMDRKIKLIDKYKNEARKIPKFEKFLVSKDRVKPCSNLTFYYDEALARRFYQEFWDMIRDVQPIHEVERHIRPTAHLDKQPPHRPSSLILPANIGISQLPLPQSWEPVNRPKPQFKNRSPTPSTVSTGTNDINETAAKSEVNSNDLGQDTDNESAEDLNEGNFNFGNINPQNYYPVAPNQELDQPMPLMLDAPATPVSRIPIPTMQPPRTPTRPTGYTPPLRPTSPYYRGTLSPNTSIRRPITPTRPIIMERWFLPGQRKTPSTHSNIQPGPSQRPTRIEEQQLQPGPSQRPTRIEEQQLQDRGAASLPPTQSLKSSKATSAKTTKTKRMDPAVKEALTSNAPIFQDKEFDGLRHYHENCFGREIQNISDTLEDNYQHIEQDIDRILSDKE